MIRNGREETGKKRNRRERRLGRDEKGIMEEWRIAKMSKGEREGGEQFVPSH